MCLCVLCHAEAQDPESNERIAGVENVAFLHAHLNPMYRPDYEALLAEWRNKGRRDG